MAKPRFTIIATVRNESGTIRSFVDGLLDQSRKPDEILIVDGASTDGTREILEEYAAQGLLHTISQPCNIAQGRNLGIAAATGTHLAVTDAGCQVDSNWLAEIAQCFESDPTLDVVAGNFRFETHTPFEDAVVRATFQPNRDQTETARYYPSSRSVAFTKTAWGKVGGYPEWLYAAEDTLFNIRMRQLGCRFAFCQNAIVRWRPRETWRALARQRINFSRGNARVGIGTTGYLINLRVHSLIAALLLAGLWFPLSIVAAIILFGRHIHKHLWSQMITSTPSQNWRVRLRVLAVMEFVRIVNLYGFMLGRWDRVSNPNYIRLQFKYMGVASADEIDFVDSTAKHWKNKSDLASGHRIPLIKKSLTIASGMIVIYVGSAHGASMVPAFAVAVAATMILLAKSLSDFSQTGPQVRQEILTYFRRYSLFALSRLTAFAFAILFIQALLGTLLYETSVYLLNQPGLPWASALAGLAAVILITGLQFCRHLLMLPASLVASSHYRVSRLYSLWRLLSPLRLRLFTGLLMLPVIGLAAMLGFAFATAGNITGILSLTATLSAATMLYFLWLRPNSYPDPVTPRKTSARPNVLMIGCDTLRADRIGPELTPFIDQFARKGTHFTHCYVPCARTAPSLVSLLTGTWPHTHGIRDNFIADADTRLTVSTLPELLRNEGYTTAALSDWCGSDMGKFPFGFDYTDLPEDQWNLKFFIRQGPKDLRLFLSLFTHNAFGKAFLPEIHYLGGVPLTDELGEESCRLLNRLATEDKPFLLNVFFSTTHPPFGSEYPYYTLYSTPEYAGESKFVMSRLTDPWEILRRQAEPREAFDLDQIIHLYDGCVRRFDDEMARVLGHLDACGLSDNTIVVLYSDHGMEFFEHGTWGQGNSAIGDHSARVPLIILDPRTNNSCKIDDVVRSIDLAPTLLDLLGLPPTPEMDGVSLTPYLRDPQAHLQLDAYNETGIWLTDMPGMHPDHLRYPNLLEMLEVPDKSTGTLAIKPEYETRIIAAKDRMIRRGRWKLTYQPLINGHILQLFDVVADPMCKQNLIDQQKDIAATLWQYLRIWIGHMSDTRPNL